MSSNIASAVPASPPAPVPGDHSCEQLANQLLRTSGNRPLRALKCSCQNGVVVIQGCVSSYYLKQLAQELVAQIDTARLIENRVEVVYEDD